MNMLVKAAGFELVCAYVGRTHRHRMKILCVPYDQRILMFSLWILRWLAVRHKALLTFVTSYSSESENLRYNQWIPMFAAFSGTSLLFGGFEVACQYAWSSFSRTDIDNVLYFDCDSNVCYPNNIRMSEVRITKGLESFRSVLNFISRVDTNFRHVSHIENQHLWNCFSIRYISAT
jgi:hypothetical protein